MTQQAYVVKVDAITWCVNTTSFAWRPYFKCSLSTNNPFIPVYAIAFNIDFAFLQITCFNQQVFLEYR